MSANEKAGGQAVGMCGCLKGIFDPETRRKAALQKYQENYRKSMTEQQQPDMKAAQLELNATGIATPYSSNPALDTIKEESSSHSKARSTHNGSHHERKVLAAESRSSLLAST